MISQKPTASVIALIASALLLSACEAEKRVETRVTPPDPLVEVAPTKTPPSENSMRDYRFMRQLSQCEDYNCTLLPATEMSVSDYEADLLDFIGLSDSDTQLAARSKIKAAFPAANLTTSLGNTTDPALFLLAAQAIPNPGTSSPEYDIVVITDGASNTARLIDWGARVRCPAQSVPATWQSTPCG